MKIGFTGTQLGMRQPQYGQLISLLVKYKPTEFHHGDCIGADAQAARTVIGQFPSIRLIAHPPTNTYKRANVPADEYRAPYPYLIRNRHIVEETDLLLVAPKGNTEELRSGTWATFRYAKRLNKPIIILEPFP